MPVGNASAPEESMNAASSQSVSIMLSVTVMCRAGLSDSELWDGIVASLFLSYPMTHCRVCKSPALAGNLPLGKKGWEKNVDKRGVAF